MSALSEFRRAKDDFFRRSNQSPLTVEQRQAFVGLTYFPENELLCFELKLERAQQPVEVKMQTSRGEAQEYFRVGQIRFEVDGQEATLQVYELADRPEEYFIPFVDATSPEESYGAGRYLEPEVVGPDQLKVDFNLSYNPYCAYNERWNCPLSPPENRLKVRIEAGEKNFHAG